MSNSAMQFFSTVVLNIVGKSRKKTAVYCWSL